MTDRAALATMHRRRPDSQTAIVSGLLALAAAGTVALWLSRSRKVYRTLLEEAIAGKVAVVTGGARGLGLAIARRLAARGARLVLISRSRDQLDAAVAELRGRGHDAMSRVCDVKDRDAVTETIDSIVHDCGGIDILVNGAGVIQATPFEHATADDFDTSLRTHFWGPFYAIKAALPSLVERRGRIVNVSSIGGRIAVPHMLPYCVGKFALSGLSDGLNAELAERGVSVLTVTPGLMRTGSYRNVTVRGQHRAEATWFALASATPLTAVDVTRAAEEIVRSAIRRDARLTVGGQAKAAEFGSAVAPELAATVARLVAGLLPAGSDSPDANVLRRSSDIDLGWLATVLPTATAVEMNQPLAPDERARTFRTA